MRLDGRSLMRQAGRKRIGATPRASRAFEELLSEHVDALYGMALRLCDGQEADAEDLLQDAVLRAFSGFASLREEAAGRAWLFTILVRTHLNRVRTVRRRAETLSSDLDEAAFERALDEWRPAATPEEVLSGQELVEGIGAALASLDPALRAVVHLVDIEGFPQREVARMLELPEGTVASRLFRVRRILRDRLTTTARELRLWRER
jgi:RNA polymerase sigma-70 factor (ECF subfamily)